MSGPTPASGSPDSWGGGWGCHLPGAPAAVFQPGELMEPRAPLVSDRLRSLPNNVLGSSSHIHTTGLQRGLLGAIVYRGN